MLATLSASATLTVRRRGFDAMLALVFDRACLTYQAPFIATALVDIDPGAPAPTMELRTRDGLPTPHFRVSQTQAAGARLVRFEVRERGAI